MTAHFLKTLGHGVIVVTFRYKGCHPEPTGEESITADSSVASLPLNDVVHSLFEEQLDIVNYKQPSLDGEGEFVDEFMNLQIRVR